MSKNDISKNDAYVFLIAFLVDSDCYDQFVNALRLFGRYDVRTIEEAMSYLEMCHYNYGEIINAMLPWSHTNEGGGFWLRKHQEFSQEYRKLIERHSKYGSQMASCKSIW